MRRCDDLITGLNAKRPQHQEDRTCATGHGDGVFRILVSGKRFLEPGQWLPADETGLFDDPGNRGVNFGLHRIILCLEVHERDVLSHDLR